MRPLRISLLAMFATLLAAPAAGAHVVHTVAPGETLWGIAAANNLTTRTVAVYNGLSPDARVVLGSKLKVPTVAEGRAALAGAPGVVAQVAASSRTARVPSAPADAPAPLGAYVVRRGDTLSGIAAAVYRNPASWREIARANGITDPRALAPGRTLTLPRLR
jgi:nucleoid-associated protein YgaU